MATVELSQAGDSSILNLYQAGNSGNIRNEQKAIHFASCQAISQSKTGHKNAWDCWWLHSKLNVQSKNDVFLKESPIPGCHFQVPYQTFWGVEARYTKIKIYTKRRQIMGKLSQG